MNLCDPSARTEDVTLPPFTNISKLPEPARDPSTVTKRRVVGLVVLPDALIDRIEITFKFNRSSEHTVWYILNDYGSGTRCISFDWTET